MARIHKGTPAKTGVACFTIAIFTMAALSGCAMSNHGVAGHFIQDGLPESAQLWKADLGDVNDARPATGTESDTEFPLDWNVYESPVPCSAIKAVHYWASGVDKNEAGLRLVGHIYGGKYFPRPPGTIHWLSPELWVEPISKTDAEKLAMYCGVEFVVRRG